MRRDGAGPEALALVGPTATGKTELALRVAERLGGEIVSMDSRQAYRGTEIGTAAPTPEQRRRVPHHGVAFLDPDERYGAGRFAELARGWIAEIRGRGRVPLLVGGTGFFLDALVDPVFEEPVMDADRRGRLEAWLEERPLAERRRWVRRLDPALADDLDTLDPQRCGRALELALLSGRPLSWWQEEGEPEAPPVDPLVVVLELAREAHRARIRDRTERLLDAGWPGEVEALLAAGYDETDPPFTAIGYRDVAALVRGERSREETVDRILHDTWSYARRQRTWFRHQLPEGALRLDADRPDAELVDRVVQAWRGATAPAAGDAGEPGASGGGESGAPARHP